MNKIKTIVICGLIIGVILLGIISFEFVLLKLLGLQYTSIRALVMFFTMYLFLEIPLSLVTESIPKSLKTVGVIKTSKGWLPLILDTTLAFTLIFVIDHFMESVIISLQGTLIFALISGLINRNVMKNDPEPPLIDSEEYEELHDKLKVIKK